jgi:enoyl-CoA hydratase/carnithine racemase
MPERIKLAIGERHRAVRLDRPDKHNALDLAMFEALARVQRQLAATRDLRAVVLCGAGVDFCSGLDVKAAMHDRLGMIRLLWKWLPWQANLAQRAGTAGAACGAGHRRHPRALLGRRAADCARRGLSHRGAGGVAVGDGEPWGLIPDMGGTLALRELLGRDQAMKLAMTAEEISGERALQLGLVTALDREPLESALRFAGELARRPEAAVNGVKRLYRKSWSGSQGAALAREIALPGADPGAVQAASTARMKSPMRSKASTASGTSGLRICQTCSSPGQTCRRAGEPAARALLT